MPTRDAEAGFLPGDTAPDEQVVAELRCFLPDFYFVNAPVSRMRRHRAILRALQHAPSGVVAHFHQSNGATYSELTLCARDDATPGLLANVSGTLAALGVSVHTAWIHTLDMPSGKEDDNTTTRVILDTLILSEPILRRPRALSGKTRKVMTQTLTDILRHEKNVEDLLRKSGRARWNAANEPLLATDLSATTLGEHTIIKLHTFDARGVLYRITRALAHLKLNVAHAQINTFEREIDDIFFVTGSDDAPLPEDTLPRVLAQLRAELGNSNV